jgi:hypothetical protein
MMDEIEFIGAMGRQQLLAQRRAKQRGYERALDDVKKYVDTRDSVKLTEIPTIVLNKTLNTLKSAYAGGER